MKDKWQTKIIDYMFFAGIPLMICVSCALLGNLIARSLDLQDEVTLIRKEIKELRGDLQMLLNEDEDLPIISVR